MSATCIAVTGAAGSLGRALLSQLTVAPWVRRIVAIDRRTIAIRHPKVAAFQCDVRDPEIAHALADCDAVIHLAFIVENHARNRSRAYSINVEGTKNVCRSANAVGVKHIVFASSVAAYGYHAQNRQRCLDEDAPLRGNPEFYYAHAKALCEHWLDTFAQAHPQRTVTRLRVALCFGPKGERPLTLFRAPVFVYLQSGCDVPMQLCHEEDVAQAFVLAVRQPHNAQGAFNIATEQPLATRDWGHAMGKRSIALPRGTLRLFDWAYRCRILDHDPVWYRISSEHPLIVSSARARNLLGWTPIYNTSAATLRALARRPPHTDTTHYV